MTTVGYGDMVPRTTAGKIVATVTMLCADIFLSFIGFCLLVFAGDHAELPNKLLSVVCANSSCTPYESSRKARQTAII